MQLSLIEQPLREGNGRHLPKWLWQMVCREGEGARAGAGVAQRRGMVFLAWGPHAVEMGRRVGGQK